MATAVIVDAVRTPSGRGKPGGALSAIHPVDLLATVLRAVVERTGIDPGEIDDVITGCVSQVGEQTLNIGRSGLLAAGYPEHVPATTIDRQCGSSQQAMHFAAQGVLAGEYDVAVACGVESMSRVPMFSSIGDKDPNRASLSARFPQGLVNQGISAEILAARWKLERATLDSFAERSHQRAARAGAAGEFTNEIVGVETTHDGDARRHLTDETVRPSTTSEGLAKLTPSFVDPDVQRRFPEIDWRITPGNSSPLTDGASAVLIMNDAVAQRLGVQPRARFHTFAVTGSDPLLMLDGVIAATEKALAKSGLGLGEIDAYEVNEAFAPVPLLWQQHFGADPDRLNPRGGAIALGHPLGASGTRLMTTLLNHLEATGGRYGLQTMCEGGGMANATIIERI